MKTYLVLFLKHLSFKWKGKIGKMKIMELDIEESIDIGCRAMEIVLSEQCMTTRFEDNQFIPSMTSKPEKASI